MVRYIDTRHSVIPHTPARIFSIVLISISLFILTTNLYDTTSGQRAWSDCKLFFTVIGKWWAGESPLYPPADSEHLAPGTAVYRFPPLWALMMVPLIQSFTLINAITVWSLLSLVVFFAGLVLVLRHLKVPVLSPQSGLILILLSLLGPLYETFFGPTHELVIIGLMAVVFVLSEREKYFWAAVAFSFAVTLKIYPLLFAFYFLLNRNYRMLFYSGLCFLGLNLIPVFLGASSETATYYCRIFPHLGGSSSYAENAGMELLFMASAWREWFNHGTGPLDALAFNHYTMNLWRVFVCFTFAGMFLLVRRRNIQPVPMMRYILFGAWTAGVLVIMPVCWDNYQILLIFPASALILWVFEEHFRPLALVVFVLYLVPIFLISTIFGVRMLQTFADPKTEKSELLAGTIGDLFYSDFVARVNYRTSHPDQTTNSRGPGFERAKEMLEESNKSSPLEWATARAKFRRESLTNHQVITLLTLRSFAGCLAFLVIPFAWLPIAFFNDKGEAARGG